MIAGPFQMPPQAVACSGPTGPEPIRLTSAATLEKAKEAILQICTIYIYISIHICVTTLPLSLSNSLPPSMPAAGGPSLILQSNDSLIFPHGYTRL